VNIEERKISKTKVILEEVLGRFKNDPTVVQYDFEKKNKYMEQEIYVQNAGLVIFQAYLPYFFNQCDLFDDNKFKSHQAAQRGALLLQYIYNDKEGINEEEMVLNKLLCGLPIEEVLPSEFVPTEKEKEIISQMFDAIISHWVIIKNSSHQGFRESWLNRAGKLVKKEDAWELTVEQRAFDVLLDQIPFSINPVRFNWMSEPIIVIWR
jgi:hypothetical protein